MNKIESAQIWLDDDMPEHMAGIIRLGAIEFFDEDGETVHDATLHTELVDNSEFHSVEKLLEHVARKLEVDSSQIEIIG